MRRGRRAALGHLAARLRRIRTSLTSRTSQPPRGPAPEGSCLICRTPGLRRRELTMPGREHLSKVVHVCRGCGYVAIEEIGHDRYLGAATIDEVPSGGRRVGTEQRPGREFQMAKMAVEVLGRSRPVDVLVYGAGASLDNHHIQRLPGVRQAAIADIMELRDDAPFVDPRDPGARRFPVVVASEVVEHFRNPPEDFAMLFGLVARDGLLVCGTNLRGRRLVRDRYLYYPDHTSLYTPAALVILARQHGFRVDFRSPAGFRKNKRYVLFSRSPDVLQQVAAYFGSHRDAPSELSDRPAAGRPGKRTGKRTAERTG
jgi:hypothetical protein